MVCVERGCGCGWWSKGQGSDQATQKKDGFGRWLGSLLFCSSCLSSPRGTWSIGPSPCAVGHLATCLLPKTQPYPPLYMTTGAAEPRAGGTSKARRRLARQQPTAGTCSVSNPTARTSSLPALLMLFPPPPCTTTLRPHRSHAGRLGVPCQDPALPQQQQRRCLSRLHHPLWARQWIQQGGLSARVGGIGETLAGARGHVPTSHPNQL